MFHVRTDLRDNGDGHGVGNPQEPWANMAEFLNSWHATGKLDHEGVYRTQTTAFNDDDSTDEGSVDEERDVQNNRPLVLKVRVASYSKQKERSRLSRLDVLKQMFEALVNRILAYSYQSHIGLISFETTARVAEPLSHVIENF